MKKANKSKTQSMALTRPLTETEKQLVAASETRDRLAAELPQFKNCDATIDGMSGIEGQMVAWEKIRDVVKCDHIEAASVAIAHAAAGMNIENPDQILNLALQQMDSLKPQSHLESMLIGQMMQVNEAVAKCMTLAFLKEQTFAGKELNANLAIKFHRTFVSQIEALQKLRGKGGQKVTVEHVHVHEGGQAIVGNVNHAPGGGG